MFSSSGRLVYSEGFKLNVEVNDGIALFARALMPKSIRIQLPRYKPHITVIRNEMLSYTNKWGIYEGELIKFHYESFVRNDDIYYWLRVFSPRLISIRLEMGLPQSSKWSRAPDGFESFHTTIGNLKN
jgi:hypothetical protein